MVFTGGAEESFALLSSAPPLRREKVPPTILSSPGFQSANWRLSNGFRFDYCMEGSADQLEEMITEG